MKVIYLAGGCFWGLQGYFNCVPGVIDTQVGYANGKILNPSYAEVCSGNTGFVEAVRVRYNEKEISLEEILELYFQVIDPTIKNRQGNDIGTQYRTGIYFHKSSDYERIMHFVETMRNRYGKPIVTEVDILKNYYPAEEYHQHYLVKNPNGYCHIPKEAFVDAERYQLHKTG